MICVISGAIACVSCNPTLQSAIFDERFTGRLLILAAPLPLIAVGIALVAFVVARRLSPPEKQSAVKTLAATMTVGVGLGGFVDGIVLHQILQWHEMFSNAQPPQTLLDKSVNMFWDGLFHAATWIVTFVGIVWLWRLFMRNEAFRANGLLSGGFMLGWAVFNLVEGTLNHYIFNVHNVREITTDPFLFNHAFMGFSALLFAAGWWTAKRALHSAAASTQHAI